MNETGIDADNSPAGEFVANGVFFKAAIEFDDSLVRITNFKTFSPMLPQRHYISIYNMKGYLDEIDNVYGVGVHNVVRAFVLRMTSTLHTKSEDTLFITHFFQY